MVKTVYEKAKLEQKKPNQQKRLSWDEFEKGPFIECKILFLLGDADNHDSSYYYEHL
jgi:hypothetical protein